MVTDFLQRKRLDSSIRKRIDILFNKITVYVNGLFYFLVERLLSIYPGGCVFGDRSRRSQQWNAAGLCTGG